MQRLCWAQGLQKLNKESELFITVPSQAAGDAQVFYWWITRDPFVYLSTQSPSLNFFLKFCLFVCFWYGGGLVTKLYLHVYMYVYLHVYIWRSCCCCWGRWQSFIFFFPISKSPHPFGHSSCRTSRPLQWLPLKASQSAQSIDVEMNIIIQQSDDKHIEQNQVHTKTFWLIA